MAGLEDLYKEIILDHYRNPRNRGELEAPPAQRAEGFNPLCGDEVVVFLDLDGEGDGATVRDIKVAGQGCSISQSSASMMSQAVKGKTAAEARRLLRSFEQLMSIHGKALGDDGAPGDAAAPELRDEELGFDPQDPTKGLGDLAALQGVVKYPVRIKCATLGWYTLRQGLDDAAAGVSPGSEA